MNKARVLFVNQEIKPYLNGSDIAEFGRYIPQSIQEKGREVRTFMPKFGDINERKNQLHEVIRLSGMNLIIDDADHQLIIKVASIQPARIQIYFIDNEDFFQRKANILDDNEKLFEDAKSRILDNQIINELRFKEFKDWLESIDSTEKDYSKVQELITSLSEK